MSDAKCPHRHTCELFPRFLIRASLKLWQIRYCDSHYENCSRYKLSCSGRAVPVNLLPNGKELPIAD